MKLHILQIGMFKLEHIHSGNYYGFAGGCDVYEYTLHAVVQLGYLLHLVSFLTELNDPPENKTNLGPQKKKGLLKFKHFNSTLMLNVLLIPVFHKYDETLSRLTTTAPVTAISICSSADKDI